MTHGPALRKSRFTYKHLSQLSLSSTTCPLRVIAHIDLDAFYAQCETVRLGLSEDVPLAVQVGGEIIQGGKSQREDVLMCYDSNGKASSQSITLRGNSGSIDFV